MSGLERSSSSPYGDAYTGTDTAAAPTSNGASSVIRWAPHGRALTACLVAANVGIVALIYLYFWRLFSGKRSVTAAGDEEDQEDASSSSASTPAPSPWRNQDQRHHDHDRLVSSLPTFVVRAGAGEKQGAAAEDCAVCIAELRDGDEARALPRCGHRFHAACVDAWLRRHTTCPLCRASVIVTAGTTGAGPKSGGGVTDTTTASVGEDMDAPV